MDFKAVPEPTVEDAESVQWPFPIATARDFFLILWCIPSNLIQILI